MGRGFAVCVCSLLSLTSPATAQVLLDETPRAGETPAEVNGGQFVEAGWQANSDDSQLVYDLGRLLTHVEVRLWLTNFDPASQSSADKHQILNMYAGRPGNHHDGDERGEAWWNVRVGHGYSDGPGVAGFKFLATSAAFAVRQEERLIQDRVWDLAAAYSLQVVWDRGEISFGLADEAPLTTFQLPGPIAVRYLFIGKDDSYPGMVGPIYTRIRVTDLSDGDPPPDPDAGVVDPDPDAGGPPRGDFVELAPVADTFVNSDQPGQSFGGAQQLEVGANRVAYLRFDVPRWGEVERAELVLNATNGSIETGGTLRGVSSNAWNENAVTWDARPAVDGPLLQALGAVSEGDEVVAEVTAAIQAGPSSMAVVSEAGDGAAYASREAGADGPLLRVWFGDDAPPDPDAGPVADGAVGSLDMTVGPPQDASDVPDARRADASAPGADGGGDAAGGGDGPSGVADGGASADDASLDGGCECQSGPAGASTWLLLVMLAAWRRRRAINAG